MSLILHLVRWDVRRFRLLLLLWLLLVAATALLEGAWPSIAVGMAARNTVGLTGNLLALAELLFSVALITLVVQDHPLVGTSAFWMTRPIPPHALLEAKLVLLTGAIVLVPVLAETVLMIVYRVPAVGIAAVAAQSALFRAFWLGVVMVFAALTPNMAKFALAVGGVILAGVVTAVTIATILIDGVHDRPPIPTADEMYDPTLGVLSTMILIGAAVMTLAVLYRTRVRPRAVAIGLVGISVAWAAASVWPWPLLAPTLETPAWAADPSTLKLSTSSQVVKVSDTIVDFGAPPPSWRVAYAPMRLFGLAPGWSAGVGLRETSIRVEGREGLSSRVRAAPARVAIDDAQSVQNNEVIRRLLNIGRLVERSQDKLAENAIVMVARTPELRRLDADRGTYEGRFLVSLTRHDIEAVLPFRSGVAVHLGAYRVSVDRIRPSQSRISVLARKSETRSVFQRDPRSRIEYYLRNVQTSEAVQGWYRELRTDATLLRFLPFVAGVSSESEDTGFRPVAIEVNFSTGYGGPQEIAFDNAWLERAELVIVRSTEAGAVERRLAIADFPIRAE
jgi:hypothetical protein